MKATETKSTHSQQHAATDKSSAEQAQERPFFSESTTEQPAFFQPGGISHIQPKMFSGARSFFQPSRVPTIQAKCAECEAEERHQEEGQGDMPEVQQMPAFESDEAPVQAKLTVGQPGDRYEQEADRVAATVVNRINSPGLGNLSQPQSVQTRLQGNSEFQQRVFLQAVEASVPNVQADFETALNRARGGGSPLDNAFRAKVEPAMGADFSGVKVHTDAEADRLNRSIQAKAFTTGQDIFFRQGTYEPESQQGQELLAHELTHVVQQTNSLQAQIIQCVFEPVPARYVREESRVGATFERRPDPRRGNLVEVVMPWSINELQVILDNVYGALHGAVSRRRRWASEPWAEDFSSSIHSYLSEIHHPSAGHGTMQLTNPQGGSDLSLLLNLEINERRRIDRVTLTTPATLTEAAPEAEAEEAPSEAAPEEELGRFEVIDLERSSSRPEALQELISRRIIRRDYSEFGQIFADRLNYAWNQIERHPSRALQEVNVLHGLAESIQSLDIPPSRRGLVTELVGELDMVSDLASHMLGGVSYTEQHDAFNSSFQLIANNVLVLEGTFRDIEGGHIRASVSSRLGPFADGLLNRLQRYKDWNSLLQRYLDSAAFNTLFSGFFLAGGLVGIGEEVVDFVRLIVNLGETVENARRALAQCRTLYEELTSLGGESRARDLGLLAGEAIVGQAQTFTRYNVVEFSYELGKLIGPAVISTALAIIVPGYEAAIAGRLLLTVSQARPFFSGLRTFTRLERMLPESRRQRRRRPHAEEPEIRLPPSLSGCRMGSIICPISQIIHRPEFSELFERRTELNQYVGEFISEDQPNFELVLRASPRRGGAERIPGGNERYIEYLDEVNGDDYPEFFAERMRQIYQPDAVEGEHYRILRQGHTEYGTVILDHHGHPQRWPLDRNRQPWNVHHEPPLEWGGNDSSIYWRPIPNNIHSEFIDPWWNDTNNGLRGLFLRELRREYTHTEIEAMRLSEDPHYLELPF